MNKNTTIGLILMALLIFGYGWYVQPSEEQIAMQRQQDSIANAIKQQAEKEQKMAEANRKAKAAERAKNDTTALFYSALNGKSQQVVLKNSSVELTLDTKGGVVKKARILGFKDRNGDKDVTLFDGNEQSLNFMLAGKTTNIITQDLYFTPSNVTDSTVTMTADAGNGGAIILDYKLGKDYMLRMSVQAKGLSGLFAPNYKEMDIEWSDKCRQQEKGFTFENRYATLTYKEKDGGTDYLSETSAKEDEKIEEKLDWVAFKNQFFSAVLISKDDFAANSLLTSIPQEKGTGYLKQYNAKLKTFFDPTGAKPTELEMFIGPNDFRLLQGVEKESTSGKDLDLQRLVYLGWPLFRIINRWFTLYVFDWLTGLGLNMGIVLILITLLLKVITYPMVKKSYMSSAKMRVLRPKLEEATKQYDKPEDQMMKQQAMMAMYSKYGVSPLSGCLPMLIQMPIWIAMFNFVPNAIQLRGESFLWISDLSTYDPIIEWNKNIWLIGDHLSLTCILFCVANVLYSIMSMRQQRDQMVGQQAEQMKMMQWMMYLMPVMFFFIFNDYSAGLNFYYFISLFFSAAIMWILRKTTDDEKLLAILEARYKENQNNPKKTSGLAARLEEMQRQAEEMKRMREQARKK
ncbi:membrane protein insertase YidC [Marseilla massiliensis]|jgi:YidC/Oxa1 family membrane protein insertase|uniref:membrane protein insertase YidC n=1 Tax=Marseilla massiliensis TaxID=1841864 RepID=UPI001F907B2D|nr:membrane protein insertase YidC [Marseilla massiliensis]MCL1609018.1 membrane protein insertase YidC [Marseilla massiliensis]HIV84745.1 membrane protein insertase YidC [Candidatus Prevotella intestinigallinarum]